MDDTASGTVLQNYYAQGAQTQGKKLVFRTSGVRDSQTASISTPVFGDKGNLVGALTVTGPISRFDVATSNKMTPHLLTAAGKLSRVLGAKIFPVKA
jgi:DNA-binding IclR family transcriptional regulator